MARYLFRMILIAGLLALVPRADPLGERGQIDARILSALDDHQNDMDNEGRNFLLHEAMKNDFLLLGELHGDNEIPALLRVIWPEMWRQGYRHIAAEVSPWAAYQLEFVPAGKGPQVRGLWTKKQATDAHAFVGPGETVLWGCDMEEEQPEFLIRELVRLNPDDSSLKQMEELTRNGYDRKIARRLLDLAEGDKGNNDRELNDVSVRKSLLATLDIETNRLSSDTIMTAQSQRERLMKDQFLQHYRRYSTRRAPAKVLLRFGRSHLHRGYDARGISTLGNFIVEFAISEHKKALNVGAFGAGGEAALLGDTWNADERQDEPAFELLADRAKYTATLFDLRPIRALLHQVPQDKRSALQTNLVYWADSYDALICYKNVTPLKP
jgi:hypothetical protein